MCENPGRGLEEMGTQCMGVTSNLSFTIRVTNAQDVSIKLSMNQI